jgi:hypothetical protein
MGGQPPLKKSSRSAVEFVDGGPVRVIMGWKRSGLLLLPQQLQHAG